VLDEATLKRVHQISREAGMQHMKVKASVEALADQGVFEGLAAVYTVDRDGDQIRPGVFEKTVARWQASGKRQPLHWNHQGEAENVIGCVNPGTMVETDDGLYVEGKLDLQDSEVARQAWRSMKNDSIASSFGFLVTDATERGDGVKELREIDLFEISLTPTPANADTRIVSMKSLDNADLPDPDTLRRWALEEPEITHMRKQTEKHYFDLLTAAVSTKRALERKASEPIRVATFEVD
jgi:Escherichia/Staphylococcus phage prohead protease